MSRQSRTRTGLRPSFDGALAGIAVASTAAVVLGALVQVRYGGYQMPLETVWRALFDRAVWTNPDVLATILLGDGHAELLGVYRDTAVLSDATAVVWTQRLPRVVVAVFVGANLAVAGAIFQAITRNELASPYILGVSSGAGFAVVITIVFSLGTSLLPVAAALGGTGAFLLVYAVAWRGGTTPVRLVLAGVVVGTVFNSLQTGVFYFIDSNGAMRTAVSWLAGTLTGVGWTDVELIVVPTLLVVPVALIAARHLDVLLLGERRARALGMRVETIRFGLSVLAILATAAAVSVAGLVGFVGLVVPHAVRTVVGSDYRRLLVGCLFAGPALVVVADVIARLGLGGVQVPVGVVTGLVGGPYFLLLLRRTESFNEF
ncbi:FecCD family ABC transporter permease [Halobacterium salinarum]|uniref:Cobalamin import system permease protein BtuC n=4 Tax=Halobacterium salinarum TaxID=2242 RepID=Q9HMG7_HALSA|nr:iron ABC transporter permease [Halobacterium salinarum]AAG20604.1 ferrichrome ABC transporter permease [Halobacterium salinarum NRC-1]MBB6089462.1 iron complex transport system permease protein [Halobacterium salinarum]MDL0118347.1 iron ABC transporter permease [Halobacterium salinarum]MDL0126917.1 iron ABC transporter permease [Halobacterium salinarum]MDL0131781.1 iron ABC transporter permease [Halobacterium salinarum]